MKLPTDKEHERLLELLGDDGYSKKLPWDSISSKYNLSIELLREFKDEINWGIMCKENNKSIDIKILSEFKNYISWGCISTYRILTVEEMDLFKDVLNWQLISILQPLSFEALDGRFNNYLISSFVEANLSAQRIKNRDWFFGYTDKDGFINGKFPWKEYSTTFPQYFYYDCYKVLIFYKDLIRPGRAKVVYPIKEFKIGHSFKRGKAVKSLYIDRINKIMYEREINRD